MRDGNNPQIHVGVGRFFRLKPTYEGWKRRSSRSASRRNSSRLKPTYEGWKRNSPKKKTKKKKGLKPTYEGWKRKPFGKILNVLEV